ncbi:MAG: group II intron reverse transcriptase/maturase [Dehalococcoidia bacterium]|nr:group II intron reverse transcriptase/maturase [Dehalococcoidia bacterium]
MSNTLMLENMTTELRKVAERARREPDAKFHSLAHLIDEVALMRAYRRQRADAAVGVDRVTKEQYAQDLIARLRDLHERLRSMRYRHQPILRKHIPKERSKKMRPIGISAFEDKLVQDAIREVLEAVYEQYFLECSYGFRPGRKAHDALRAIDRVVYRGEVNWILEADITSFFDSLDRSMLSEMLRERVPDGSLLRLIGKCLHVGVLDGEEFCLPEYGTTQGSVLSPMLGNIYLHHALDLWFEEEAKPRVRGKAHLIRYADDFVIGFELQEDAKRVMEVLHKRMAKYGLTLHADKTRLMPFRRPSAGQNKGKGPGTFEFLGFKLYWRRTRKGQWEMACKTRHARLNRAIRNIYEWCRSHRHLPIPVQHAALVRRIQGHFNYFGVNGNSRSLSLVKYHAERAWYKWLCRRSQRGRLNWERFEDLLRDFPLPQPRISVQIWGAGK